MKQLAAIQSLRAEKRVRLRPVALPVEHGGWSLLLEPIALGLVLAPSPSGLFISVSALCFFLARHPYKIAAKEWSSSKRGDRFPLAVRFASFYFAAGVLSGAVAIRAGGTRFLLPVLMAAPLVGLQLFHDSKGRSRAPLAEIAGAFAVGSLATAVATGAGWPARMAFGLWAIVVARSVPTVLYLRVRLRISRRKVANRVNVICAHALAVLALMALAWMLVVPWLAAIAIGVLTVRAAMGLRNNAPVVRPQTLGLREIGFGLLTVLATVIGYTTQFR